MGEGTGKREALLPPKTWIRGSAVFLCVTDAFGNLMASVDLLHETKTHVRSFAHGIGGS